MQPVRGVRGNGRTAHRGRRHRVEAVIEAVESATGIPATELDGAYTVHSGRRVAEHLFSVASGLESVVSGEGEIAGQVRRALKSARKDGTTSPELERLFQRASQAQRKVKNVTALGRAAALSCASHWSWPTAASRIGPPSGCCWSAPAPTPRSPSPRSASAAPSTSRCTPPPAAPRCSPRSTASVRSPPTSTPAPPAHSSLLITCTTATEPVLGPEHLQLPVAAVAAGCPVGAHSRLVVDLGMPRNVDPAVAALEGVALLDLETIRLHAPLEELQATDAARSVVREAAETSMWWVPARA